MNKAYVIYWKSKVNGRSGKGTLYFDREEAEKLAAELNRDYPEIEHEARSDDPVDRAVSLVEPALTINADLPTS
jgi:hypothetical protein